MAQKDEIRKYLLNKHKENLIRINNRAMLPRGIVQEECLFDDTEMRKHFLNAKEIPVTLVAKVVALS